MHKLNSLRCAAVLVIALIPGGALLAGSPAPAAIWKPVAPTRIITKVHKKPSRYAAGAMPQGARRYYAMTYGVDQLSAKLTESGALVRFSYRVIDPTKAKALQDQAAAPTLTDEAAHVALVVPTLEKVGPLRQTMAAEAGKSYWVAFSNKGSKVKAGERVAVVVGPLRVDGLIVE